MGALIRNYDWHSTTIGEPDNWPQSLLTTVSNLLGSKFPMFLWWGKDMIQFYNDAFRPSFGNEGKHPQSLGQSGKACWPEIWDIIYPIIHQVKEDGDGTWMENQLVPIYRNGKLEDLYWTLSYSLVLDDDGSTGGVLVTCMETTAHIKSIQRLKQEQLSLALAVEIGKLGNFTIDLKTGMASYSKQIMEWFGFVEHNLPLNQILTHIHEEDKHFVEGTITNTIDGKDGGRHDITYRLISEKNLPVRYLRSIGQVQYENGNPISLSGIIQDETVQMVSRKEIEDKQRILLSLFQESPVGIASIKNNAEFTFEFANVFYGSLVGRNSEDLVGKPLLEAIPEIRDQGFDVLLKQVIITQKPYEAKEQPVTLNRDGHQQTIYVNFTYQPKRDVSNNITSILVVVVDVTQQVYAREKIEKSERVLRNMILKAPVAICIFRGEQFIIEIANEKMFAFWGRSSYDVMHKPLFEALPEARGQGYEELLHNVLNSGIPYEAREMPVSLYRNGVIQKVFINFSYEPLYDAEGYISGIMAVAADVTFERMSRKEIEEAVVQRTKQLAEANGVMAQTNKELYRSNAQLEEFAHAASHDLKEPVRKITVFTDRLKDQLGNRLSETELKSFERIKYATERMENLIDDLLLYSHVSHRPHDKEFVDLNITFNQVIEDLELTIQEKKALINVTKLPFIQGYIRQLQQLFQNIISNSLKYTKDQIPPQIDVFSSHVIENGETYNVISIRDNGIGFDEQYTDKIFQMFARLHGKNEYSGTGVGLSIVKKIVENHQGFMRVESSIDKGSTFHVYLPVN